MKWLLSLLVIVLPTALSVTSNTLAEGTPAERGKDIYAREGCAVCHSLHGKGNRRNPLDGVAQRLGRDEIRRWIVAPQEMKPGIRKRSYKLSDEELDALIEYIGKSAP